MKKEKNTKEKFNLEECYVLINPKHVYHNKIGEVYRKDDKKGVIGFKIPVSLSPPIIRKVEVKISQLRKVTEKEAKKCKQDINTIEEIKVL